MRDQMPAELVVDALEMAINRGRPTGKLVQDRKGAGPLSWAFHADPTGRDDLYMSGHLELRLRAATLDDATLAAAVLNECTSEYLGRPSSIEDAVARLRLGD